MYHPVKTIQDFTKSLKGLWLNPRTNNQFFFSVHKSNPVAGEINILQYGAHEPVPLHFDLSAIGGKIFMTVEGQRYRISLHDIPANSLYITLKPKRTLRLLKY